MAYFKEIVTKAVIGKGKKTTTATHTIKPNNKPNTILGCWIINHSFKGLSNKEDVLVNGSYDVNVWYSYDNDSKTDVCNGNFTYSDKMNVPLSNNANLTNNTEVIVTSLVDPNVVEVNVVGDTISFTIKKEMGIEIVGDTKIRVNVEDDFDDFKEIYDKEINEKILNQIDAEVNDDYLKDDTIVNIEEDKKEV